MNRDERTLEPLFSAIVRLCFSVWFELGQLIHIDVLPAWYGCMRIHEVFRACPEYRQPRLFTQVLQLAALLDLLDWFPILRDSLPAWTLTGRLFCETACKAVIYFQICSLLIFLSERAGRADLAENGRRFRLVFLVPYLVLNLAYFLNGQTKNMWWLFLLILQLAIAAYAANCHIALCPGSSAGQNNAGQNNTGESPGE